MRMTDDQRKNHPNAAKIKILISFIALVFLTTIILFTMIISDVDGYYKDIEDYIFTIQSSSVIEIKNLLEDDLDKSLQTVSEQMEEEILQLDLDELEEQLNRGVIPDELSNIFEKYYTDLYLTGIENDDNDIFICTSNGIIYDSDLQYASEKGLERNWDYEISHQYNKDMASKTISNLLYKNSDSFLVFERKCSHEYGHQIYSSINEESLKTIISTEGLERLKDYTFLVPLYITENGDIFGKDDVVDGHLQKNNKFIIVQEYNLYDYIMIHHSLDSHMNITTIKRDHTRLDTLLKVFAISDIVAVVCSILFFSVLANDLYDANEEKAKLKKGNDNNDK